MSNTKTSTTEERERISKILVALASMAPSLAATFVEAFDIVPLSAVEKRYMNGPVIVHAQGGYTAMDLPEWMVPQIRVERLEIILGLQPDMIVGPTEITAVMHAATYEAPLQREIGEIYVWAGAHAVARHKNCTPEEMWMKLYPDDPMITHDMVIRRGGRLFMHYNQLAHEIRRKVDRSAKSNTDLDRLKAMAAFFRNEPPRPLVEEAPPLIAIAAE
jgi:hypothetical protein